MDRWQPLEILGLIAVGAFLLAALGWAAAWYTLRARQLELSGFGAEAGAAKMLGRTLAGQWMSAYGVQEVMAAFNSLEPCQRAVLALAVQGLVSKTDRDNVRDMRNLESKVVALVRTFKRATSEDIRAEADAAADRPRGEDGSSHNIKPA